MSTRGAFGFRLNGVDRITYNHSDSYPSGLGADVLNFLATARGYDLGAATAYDSFLAKTKERVGQMVPVEDDAKPTPEQIEALAPFTQLGVGNNSTDDWYCLLRETQGDIGKMLAARYFQPADDFIMDSLFCEYAYIINLDDETLEFYRGFQKLGTPIPGRYGEAGKDKPGYGADKNYGPVALVQTWPLREAIADGQAILAQMESKIEEAAA